MAANTSSAEYTSHSMGADYYFCSSGCKERFDDSADIQQRDTQMSNHDHSSHQSKTAIDPICNMTVQIENAEHTANVKGVDYYFCSSGCKEKFLTISEA